MTVLVNQESLENTAGKTQANTKVEASSFEVPDSGECIPLTRDQGAWDWSQMIVEEVLLGGATGFFVGMLTTYIGLRLFYQFRERERQAKRERSAKEKHEADIGLMLDNLLRSLVEDSSDSLRRMPLQIRSQLEQLELKHLDRKWKHREEFLKILDVIETRAHQDGGMAQSYLDQIAEINRIRANF